ncbi:tetratricopeptide repeat protein [Sphingomicrobium nitratireducens]|uniref:tetratricopeptide repeat protein n=1 Tax=Sphingomicrobium nitratireducens TaxID=2964666 RepID=UPI00224073B2
MPAAAASPERLDLYVGARTAEAIGDSDRAATLFAQLVASGASNPELGAEAMTSAIAAGRFDLARTIAADPVLARDLNLDGRLFLLGETLRRARYDEALALLSQDEARVSLDFIAPFVRAWIGMASDKPHERERAILALSGLSRQSPLNAFIDEHLAHLYLLAGDLEAARPLLVNALANAGGREAGLRIGYAEGFAKAGDRSGALALLEGPDPVLTAARERLLAGRPLGLQPTRPADGYAALLTALSVQLNRIRDRTLPVAMAQIARASSPGYTEAAIVGSLLMDMEERPEDAIALVATVPQESLLYPQALDSRIQLLLEAGRIDEAMKLARDERKRRPRSSGVEARIGDVYAKLERWSDAADAYARERALQPDDWTIYFLEAVARDEAGDWEAARSLLHSAMALAPEEPILLNFLGYAQLERGEAMDEAEALIRAASALSPEDPSITDSLGWAHFKRGRLDEAVEVLGRAARLDPDQAEIHEHYGDALWASGRTIEARFAWRAARVSAEEEDRIARLDDKLALGLTEANGAP